MRWVAASPEVYMGRKVGDGHCVAFVRESSGAPATAQWRKGARARGGLLQPGTAIATFHGETYGNRTDGSSHAAILMADLPDGLLVWDQWVGHPVQQRVLRYRDGAGHAVDDGSRFFAIETRDVTPAV